LLPACQHYELVGFWPVWRLLALARSPIRFECLPRPPTYPRTVPAHWWPSNRGAFPCGNYPAFSAAAFASGIVRPYQRPRRLSQDRPAIESSLAALPRFLYPPLCQARRAGRGLYAVAYSSVLYAVAYGARRPVADSAHCHSRKAATVSPPFRRPYRWPAILCGHHNLDQVIPCPEIPCRQRAPC